MQAPEKLETAVDAQQFLDGLDTILFDCDGVLWQGSKVISGTRDVLDQLRRMGKRIIFVTNNSTKSRAAYSKKFTSLGLEASPEEIFGSAYAAAAYIKNVLKLPSDKKLYVCGMKGIEEELTAEGIPFVGGEAEKDHIGDLSRLDSLKPDDSIGAVLFGMDIDISYTKYAKAFTYLHSNPDCHFLATNDDLTFPAGGTVYPGTGALLAALKAPLNRSPKVLGKPHQTMLDVIVDKYHLNKERTCMVGDRLDTDIEFGKKGGLKTLLVLTGVTSEETLKTSEIRPDYVAHSIAKLLVD